MAKGLRVARPVQSAAERKTLRQRLGSLRSLKVLPATAKRYAGALQLFFRWLQVAHPERVRSVSAINKAVCDFLEMLWDEGWPRGRAGDTLSGLQWQLPPLKGRLGEAWQLFAAWGKAELVTRAAPVPPVVLKAFVAISLAHGRAEVALALWLCFHGLLRAAEVLHLAVADVQVDVRRRSAVLTLRGTKSGQRFGAVESIILDDAQLVLFLAAVVRNKPLGARVVSLSYAQLHRALLDLLSHCFLEQFYIRPHSFRRGGATDYFQNSGNLAETTLRGRWKNQSTARLYIDMALSESILLQIPGATSTFLQKAACSLPQELASWGCMECRTLV
eukprot:4614965-Amphidinium_carterae.4